MNISLSSGNNISLSENINPLMIKQKIIQTDKIIKQYSFKCKENEMQNRKLDNMNELMEQLKKDCRKYENELSQVLQELEPLKSKWTALKDENNRQIENIKLLEDKLSTTEKLVEEYIIKLRNRREESQEENNKKALILEQENERKQKEIERYKDRLQMEKAFNSNLSQKYKFALKDLLKFGAMLKKQNLLSKSEIRILNNSCDVYMKSDFDTCNLDFRLFDSMELCDDDINECFGKNDDFFESLLKNDNEKKQNFDTKYVCEKLEKFQKFDKKDMDILHKYDNEDEDFVEVEGLTF